MIARLRSWLVLAAVALGAGCGRATPEPAMSPATLAETDWGAIGERARGTTVRYATWAGEEARNRFFDGPVTEALQRELGIALEIVPLADTADLVNKLLNEKAGGRRTEGGVDLVWINGENFRTAKQGALLWGPFAEKLPNVRYFDAVARARDFGTATEGYEAPWQESQFVFAYDTARVERPPTTLDALRAWVAANPGRFTYPAIPDFTGSAFVRQVLLHSGESPDAFSRAFDPDLYARASSRALAFLTEIAPHLWRKGETYPATVADMDRLFANGEIDFSMNYGPTFASEKIARGEFPATVRTFVLDEGTLHNYSFLAIPFNAANVPGALAVTNYLMSPGHALARSLALGGLFPMKRELLTEQERELASQLPRGLATLPLDILVAHRIAEADAEYLVRFERDWRAQVLQR